MHVRRCLSSPELKYPTQSLSNTWATRSLNHATFHIKQILNTLRLRWIFGIELCVYLHSLDVVLEGHGGCGFLVGVEDGEECGVSNSLGASWINSIDSLLDISLG